MANEAQPKKSNKILVTVIAAAAVIVGAIIVAVLLIVLNTNPVVPNNLTEDYFVSDSSKYVLTTEAESGDRYGAMRSHMVFQYSGDEIKSLVVYYEFADADAAKAALTDEISQEIKSSGAKEVYIKDKYVVAVATEAEYANIKASEIKSMIDLNESLKGKNE